MSADKNYKLIVNQIKKYKPNYFIINDYPTFLKIKNHRFKYCKIINKFDFNNLKKNDIIISAIPGIAGLKPTIDSIRYCKNLFIANKESIVCGWDIIKKNAKRYSKNCFNELRTFFIIKVNFRHKC